MVAAWSAWVDGARDELTSAVVGRAGRPPCRARVLVRRPRRGATAARSWRALMPPLDDDWRAMPFTAIDTVSGHPHTAAVVMTGGWLHRPLPRRRPAPRGRRHLAAARPAWRRYAEIRHTGGAVARGPGDGSESRWATAITSSSSSWAAVPAPDDVAGGTDRLAATKAALGERLTARTYLNGLDGAAAARRRGDVDRRRRPCAAIAVCERPRPRGPAPLRRRPPPLTRRAAGASGSARGDRGRLLVGDPAGEEQRDERDERQHRQRGAQAVEAGVGVLVDDRVGGARAARRRRRARPRGRRRRRTGPRRRARSWPRRRPSSGTSGFGSMPVRNDAVSAEMSTAPASAVPIDAPRFVTVFCSPPTSPLCSSGTDDDGHAPSCDASAPMPRPASSIGHVTISGPAPGVERGDQHDEPGEQREEAELDDPPRRRVREELRDAGRGEQQRDRQRQQPHAGGDRREPERDRQEQRDREEQAGLQEVLEEERGRGRRAAAGCAASPGRRAARAPRRCRRLSHARNSQQHDAAAEDQPDRPATGPSHSGAPGLGCTKPHVARAQDAEDDRARGRAPTARCRRGRAARRLRAACRPCGGSSARMREHDEHLAGEHQPPREVGREEPADQRPGGDRDRAGRRDQAVGARAARSRPKFDATSATIAGMISAAPMPSRNDQPMISTARFGASAVDERPAAVDDAADGERPLAAR